MKNSIKTIILSIAVLLSSCSKDNPEPQQDDEKVFKVEVQYSGNIDKFEETLILQVASKKASSMKIVEQELGKESPSNDVAWFTKPIGPIKGNATYSTSEKASIVTVAGVLTPIQMNEQGTENVKATIKFYTDGQLKETKTVTATANVASTPFSFPVSAN